jgi:hypothetical protein
MNIPRRRNDDTCYDVIKNCYNDKYTKKKKYNNKMKFWFSTVLSLKNNVRKLKEEEMRVKWPLKQCGKIRCYAKARKNI